MKKFLSNPKLQRVDADPLPCTNYTAQYALGLRQLMYNVERYTTEATEIEIEMLS